ncbi:hypothetical protein HZS_1643 [Henneguya salminicola]|nr:hypothetical protein HZS_1643 [Henneguya salminicola]
MSANPHTKSLIEIYDEKLSNLLDFSFAINACSMKFFKATQLIRHNSDPKPLEEEIRKNIATFTSKINALTTSVPRKLMSKDTTEPALGDLAYLLVDSNSIDINLYRRIIDNSFYTFNVCFRTLIRFKDVLIIL